MKIPSNVDNIFAYIDFDQDGDSDLLNTSGGTFILYENVNSEAFVSHTNLGSGQGGF